MSSDRGWPRLDRQRLLPYDGNRESRRFINFQRDAAMTISLTEDFKTVEELRAAPEAILEQVKKNGQPVVITAHGKPAAVLLDVATFERMLRTLNLVRLIGPAEEDVLAGRTRPLDEFMSEFYCENNISSGDNQGSGKRRAGNSQLHRSGQKERRRKVGP